MKKVNAAQLGEMATAITASVAFLAILADRRAISLRSLAIAALVSIVLLLVRASQPAVTTMGRIPGTRDGFGDVTRHPDAWQVPGVMTLRLDTPLYYFNATEVETRVLQMVESADPRPHTVVLDVGVTNDLDVTTADGTAVAHFVSLPGTGANGAEPTIATPGAIASTAATRPSTSAARSALLRTTTGRTSLDQATAR